MSRYCLDTSAYSNFKLGDPQIIDILDGADWIGMPAVVLGELWTGFLQGRYLGKNEAELREFLANSVVEVLLIDSEAARIYGELVAALRKAGTPLPTNDIWIASVAVRAGATVLTYDSHFHSISRVGSQILETGDPTSAGKN
jgi:tRNA(fMet)-specific endonuclease VapC